MSERFDRSAKMVIIKEICTCALVTVAVTMTGLVDNFLAVVVVRVTLDVVENFFIRRFFFAPPSTSSPSMTPRFLASSRWCF